MHYFKTVKDVGTTEAKAVMEKMKELPINDFMTTSGRIREDGRVIRDMYLLETKKPSESTGEWDLIRSSALCPSQATTGPMRSVKFRDGTILPVVGQEPAGLRRGTQFPRLDG